MSYNLAFEKKTAVIASLCENASIRAVERMTGIHRDTIMRLGARAGEAGARILDERMRGLTCKQIEVDEIWGRYWTRVWQ